MPFQWVNGSPPLHLIPKKVLVLGPDEMYDSDYSFVKKVLDEFTLKLEHFNVVVMGNGLKNKTEDQRKVYFGTDRVVIKWCDYYKLTRYMLPARNYRSEKERDRDLVDTLGEGAFCCYFRDREDEVSRRVYRDVVRRVVSHKRTRIVRV